MFNGNPCTSQLNFIEISLEMQLMLTSKLLSRPEQLFVLSLTEQNKDLAQQGF